MIERLKLDKVIIVRVIKKLENEGYVECVKKEIDRWVYNLKFIEKVNGIREDVYLIMN